jgi:DNA-binding response OmpR family regulator
VLIVDDSEETREVLQTALERRGHRIYSTDRAERGIELARAHHPDLIVLDLDLADSDSESLSAPFAEQSNRDGAGLVLLGSVRRLSAAGGEGFAKPYHYGPLVRKIEELLTSRGPLPCRRCS